MSRTLPHDQRTVQTARKRPLAHSGAPMSVIRPQAERVFAALLGIIAVHVNGSAHTKGGLGEATVYRWMLPCSVRLSAK
jgi:hypothetical protein